MTKSSTRIVCRFVTKSKQNRWMDVRKNPILGLSHRINIMMTIDNQAI